MIDTKKDLKQTLPIYNPQLTNIQNFFLYKNLRGKYDCDALDISMQVHEELVKKSKNCRFISRQDRNITIEYCGVTQVLESDTMDSFMTLFNEVVRVLVILKLNTELKYVYKQSASEPDNEIKRNLWIMSNYQSLFKDDKKILFLLETFAAKTHTIGNFMLIPKGDGFIKNRRFKEDLDRYIRNIDSNHRDLFLNNEDLFLLADYWDKDLSNESVGYYLEGAISRIDKRAEKISYILKS